MNEQISVAIGILLLMVWLFLRFFLHRRLANRADKPKITFMRGLEGAIAIIAVTIFWKWDIGFPWGAALMYALILAAGIAVIWVSYYLLYWRDK